MGENRRYIKCFAHGKITLALRILGTQGRMHVLDALFVPIALFDVVRAKKRADGDFSVTYVDGRVYEDDTVLKMARAVKDRYNIGGADFYIDKRIIDGAGLGGSSADAGTAARCLQRLYRLAEIERDVLIKAGSDAPYFYKGGTQRVRGIGETVEGVRLPKLYKVIIVPQTKVSTKEAFAKYDEIGGDDKDINSFIGTLTDKKAEVVPFNALERAACELNPDVKRALALLKDAGFNATVTGSGSACFGVERSRCAYKQKIKRLLVNLPKDFEVIT